MAEKSVATAVSAPARADEMPPDPTRFRPLVARPAVGLMASTRRAVRKKTAAQRAKTSLRD
jgi:hypothetical protein